MIEVTLLIRVATAKTNQFKKRQQYYVDRLVDPEIFMNKVMRGGTIAAVLPRRSEAHDVMAVALGQSAKVESVNAKARSSA